MTSTARDAQQGARAEAAVRDMPGESLWADAARWEQISPDPFSGPDWFRVWCEHFGHTGRWHPTAAYAGDTLVGVAPWVESHETRWGLPLRQIKLACCVYSPVTNLLFDKSLGPRPVCASLVRAALAREWDVMRLTHVPEEQGLADCLRECLWECDIPFVETESVPNWHQPVNGTAEEYLATLSHGKIRGIGRCVRTLSKAAPVSMKVLTAEEDVDLYMSLYYQLYAASWKKPEPDPTFHRDLARAAARRGWLRLGFCFAADRPVAVHLWLVRNRVAYGVKTCFDEEYRRYGPGAMLSVHMLRHVIDQDRVQELDFLKGDEDYKKDWVQSRRTRRQFVAFNPRTVRGRIAALAAMRVHPLVRRAFGTARNGDRADG